MSAIFNKLIDTLTVARADHIEIQSHQTKRQLELATLKLVRHIEACTLHPEAARTVDQHLTNATPTDLI